MDVTPVYLEHYIEQNNSTLETISIMGDPLDEILEGLRGISRLENSLKQATDRFTEEFDLVRTELAALNEAKTRDSVTINNLNKTVNAIQQDISNIAERHSAAETKIHSLDNTSNKNKERIFLFLLVVCHTCMQLSSHSSKYAHFPRRISYKY